MRFDKEGQVKNPPLLRGGGAYLSGILTNDVGTTQVLGFGEYERIKKPDQPLGSPCELPRVEHNCDLVGREPSLPLMPQMRHVCCVAGSQCPAPLNTLFPTGPEEKHRRMAVDDARAGTSVAITTYGCTLATFTYFKCLVVIMLASYDDLMPYYE